MVNRFFTWVQKISWLQNILIFTASAHYKLQTAYSSRKWMLVLCCLMKQNCYFQRGVAECRHAATPLSSYSINTTLQGFQKRYLTLLYLKGLKRYQQKWNEKSDLLRGKNTGITQTKTRVNSYNRRLSYRTPGEQWHHLFRWTFCLHSFSQYWDTHSVFSLTSGFFP